jgi:hypothetical protein
MAGEENALRWTEIELKMLIPDAVFLQLQIDSG